MYNSPPPGLPVKEGKIDGGVRWETSCLSRGGKGGGRGWYCEKHERRLGIRREGKKRVREKGEKYRARCMV